MSGGGDGATHLESPFCNLNFHEQAPPFVAVRPVVFNVWCPVPYRPLIMVLGSMFWVVGASL